MSDSIPQHIRTVMPTVLALLNAPAWADTHKVLVREQKALLSDAAEQAIELLMQQAEHDNASDKGARLSMLTMHQTLIHDARTYGVEKAWRAFEAFMRLMEAVPPSTLLAPPGRE